MSFVAEPEIPNAGDKVYFTDTQRQTLGDLANTAHDFLNRNPTRAEFDSWQATFHSIEPSFYPIPEVEKGKQGKLSDKTELPQYQDAQRRLHSQTI